MEKVISKINNINIAIIDNGIEKLVPIKPICQALGIAFQSQSEKIKNDEILRSTVTLSVTVGEDGKQREMVCLPLKYIFGWLFTINPGNVSNSARVVVRKYRLECYNVLYNYFSARALALDKYNKQVLAMSERIALAQYEFATTRNRLNDLRKEFAELRSKDVEEMVLDAMSELPFEEK